MPVFMGSGMPTSLRVLSILTAIFPGGPGLAGIRISSFRILLELRVMEVVVTTTAVRCAKLQSNHHQQTNTQLLTGRMPFLSPNQQCQSTEEKSCPLVKQNFFTAYQQLWSVALHRCHMVDR